MVRIKKPHKTNYFGGKLPDFRPLALYKHKDLTEHTNDVAETFLYDEMAPRQAGRPVIGNRCLQYVSGATITFESITGTLWGLTKVAGVWAWRDMSSLLSGLVLTMDVAHTHYGAFKDDVWFVNCEDGDTLNIYGNTGFAALISNTNLRDTQSDKPFIFESGDNRGWSFAKSFEIRSDDYYFLGLSGSGTNRIIYRQLVGDAFHFSAYHTILAGAFLSGSYVDGNGVTRIAPANGWQTIDGLEKYVIYQDKTLFAESVLFQSDLSFDAATIRLKCVVNEGLISSIYTEDYSIDTDFRADVDVAYGVTTTGLITNFEQWILAIDADDFSGVGAGHVDGATYPETQLGFPSGTTCANLREKLTSAGISEMSIFITQVHAVAALYPTNINWRYTLQRVAIYSLNLTGVVDLSLGTDVFVATGNRSGFANLAYFGNYDRTLKEFFRPRFQGSDNVSTYPRYNIEIEEFTIDENSVYPVSKNDNNLDSVRQKPIEVIGPRDWPARVNESGDLDLAYEFWDRPAAWDNYIPGITEDDTVHERDNGGSIDRICVFNETPTGEQLTRAQRFTKDKV